MPETKSISLTYYRLAGEVAAYMRAHVCERELLSIARLARHFGVCGTVLKASFKHRHGTTIHQFILVNRVEMAKKMLQERSLQIKEVAWELGYGDIANFSRDFKKVVGCGPREWAKAEGPAGVREMGAGRMEMV